MNEGKNNSNRKKKSKKRSSCSKVNVNNNSYSDGNSSCNNNTSNQSSNNNSKLCCFSALDYIILASTLAIALGEELSTTDVAILSTFFAVLSDELALIGSIDTCNDNGDDDIFVPPIPDVALTSMKNNINKKNTKKKK